MQAGTTTETDFFTTQDWSAYSAEQHAVWQILYERRMSTLENTGCSLFLSGAKAIGMSRDSVPDLYDVNRRLRDLTGWRAVPVTGFLPAAGFFACLADRRFPTTVTIRTREQLDYLPEPDIFHDVFGHVPLHADPVFGDFLQRFGAVACRARTEEETTWMARLFWFTVEFGLIVEGDAVRVYGSGLISSHGDAAQAFANPAGHRPFVLDDVISQPFEIDRMQETLFVVRDFRQLFDAVTEMAGRIGRWSGY
ncbi:MAG TPA: phenylalanine 4-monooxygenase [Longimicrobiales bacterium]